MQRLLTFACLASLLLVPLATAGTAADPEISDPAGDGGADSLDIKSVWIDPLDSLNLTIHLTLGAAPPAPAADTNQCASGNCVFTSFSYRILFRVLDPAGIPAPQVAGYSSTYVVYRAGPKSGGLTSPTGFADDGGVVTYDGGEANITVTGSEIIYRIPRASPVVNMPTGATPGAYTIDQMHAYSSPQLCFPSPVGCAPVGKPSQTSGTPPAGTVSHWDDAPDSGFGRGFVFPATPPPTAATTTTTSTTTTSHTTATSSSTTTSSSSTTTAPTAPVTTNAASSSSAPAPIAQRPTAPAKQSPALGTLAVAALVLGLGLVRRRLNA